LAIPGQTGRSYTGSPFYPHSLFTGHASKFTMLPRPLSNLILRSPSKNTLASRPFSIAAKVPRFKIMYITNKWSIFGGTKQRLHASNSQRKDRSHSWENRNVTYLSKCAARDSVPSALFPVSLCMPTYCGDIQQKKCARGSRGEPKINRKYFRLSFSKEVKFPESRSSHFRFGAISLSCQKFVFACAQRF
jgi:hypothetical protein